MIQELALARAASVHYGGSEVHWDDFRDTIGIFHRYLNFLRPKLTDSPALEPLSTKLLKPDDTFQSTMSLEMLVSTLSASKTSDPRDTINALMNIAKESNLPEDYNKDLFQVYRDFLKWIVESTKVLNMICRHWALPERAIKGPLTPRLVMLPSWIQTVDDSAYGRGEDFPKFAKPETASWVYLVRAITTPLAPISPSGSKGPTKQVRLQNKGPKQDILLLAGGLLIGTVTWSSDPIPDGVIPQRCLKKMGWSNEKGEEIRKAPSELWRTLVADREPNGGQVSTACLYCLLNRTPNGHINTKALLEKNEYSDQPSIVQDYLECVQAVTWNWDGLVGLGPPKAQSGDVIVILYGCSVPVILRPSDSDSETGEPEWYGFVGEAYIYGKMDGEAMYGARVSKDFRP
ncbi:hypothetical protein K504DRAFT_480599 [Pleomassaria siparia CBS 279.74]|uniref:Heterokaryon incompatibility domain-containing protein n=1 Tax=Pleomassaria siparia CBS 279.74 TaxID=1314801 RepID=A0A6G1KFM3_9PLEO|nr:hypothetical protein K504DRAFT_480599 [Pleomassaria siparia CBS 279.74]